MKVAREVVVGAVSILKGMGVTLSYLFRKKVTMQYPEERPVLTERFRGVPALPIDPATGTDRCIACSACQRVCPVVVINVSGEKGDDGKRHVTHFTLDTARCIFCGLCVEVCPTGALVLSDEFELAHYTRQDLILGLDKLREIGGFFPSAPEEAEAQEPKPQEPQSQEPAPGKQEAGEP